jgi:sirohydrochlorin ferrochelatase
MKVTRVQYTVRAEFVEANKRNIDAVMRELRATGNNDVKYAVYLQQDGRTFMHIVHQGTIEAERFPTSLESFKTFQAQLRPNLEGPPQVEALALVESSAPKF